MNDVVFAVLLPCIVLSLKSRLGCTTFIDQPCYHAAQRLELLSLQNGAEAWFCQVRFHRTAIMKRSSMLSLTENSQNDVSHIVLHQTIIDLDDEHLQQWHFGRSPAVYRQMPASQQSYASRGLGAELGDALRVFPWRYSVSQQGSRQFAVSLSKKAFTILCERLSHLRQDHDQSQVY